jgi:hypothetical protein
VMPTDEAVALTTRMGVQLQRTEAGLTQASTAVEVNAAERLALVHELWLPSHHEYASVGAVLRVMNYLCFVNSKVLFRQLRNSRSTSRPVAIQINYHADAALRMKATLASYLDGDREALKALPLADGTGAGGAPLPCDRGGGDAASAQSKLGAHLIAHSPFAWGGVGDMVFKEGGVLDTPWGKGTWGLHPADTSGQAVYADFVGAKHNLVFSLETEMGVSTRCDDNNVVLVRSIKAAKEKPK